MKLLSVITILVFQIISSNACCTDGSTIIQIKNYDGPIYLHAPQNACDDKILHTSNDFDCNCPSKPTLTCFPLNTATASGGLYPYPMYQDTQCTPYNVPYNQDCPVVQIAPQSVVCSVPKDNCYVCGKCGKRF